MKTILRLEEILMFLLGIYLFGLLPFAWWWFLLLILLPDIGMLGYFFGNGVGAITYNVLHHKGLAVACYLMGTYLSLPLLQLAGVILFSHACLDWALGYGLKYRNGFKFTHLGQIE